MSRLSLPSIPLKVEPPEVVWSRAVSRLRFIRWVVAAAFVAVGVRGAQLTVFPDDKTLRSANTSRWSSVEIRGRRGEVVDRDGNLLATSVDTPDVVVDPVALAEEKIDVDALAAELASILELGDAEVRERLVRPGARYVVLAKRVHPEKALAVKHLQQRGVWVQRASKRYYPEGTLAAHVLGFVSADGDGSEGLEASQNEHLRGQEILTQRRRDRRGGGVDDLLGEYDGRMSAGKTVVLTIDRQIQRITERALEQVMVTSQPAAASAIVVEVATGDLLALASVPTYNPNDPGDDPVPRWNHAVYDTIEPGSVFKPFTVAAAMEEGLVSEFSPVDCEGGGWNIGRARIRDDHPHGRITLTEVIKYSSNIGSAKLALEMGEEDFLGYMRRFGFGQATGVPLPGEPKGKIRRPETIKKIELATTAFGQGVTTTPLQLAMATAALANDGALMRPRLVSQVVDAYGTVEQLIEPELVEQVVSPETAQAVRRMMVTVTEPGGTATRARVPGFVVGGKTGTAQKAENGAYGKGRIGSFVGFIPADKPVLAIVVSVDDPSVGSRYGGIVAAPAFATIAEESMRVLGIVPDPALLPNPPGQLKGEPASPKAPSSSEDRTPAVRWTGSGWELPALDGLTTREAMAALNGSGLRLQVVGEGVVVQQSPGAGAVLAPGGSLRLSLADPELDGGV